jgi:uridine kinase
MTLKSVLPGSEALLCKVQECLGPNRLPFLIAIDGADGLGKSSLASWLGWQLGAPTIHLDLYLVRGSNPIQWRTEDLERVVNTRLVEHKNPLIVEGIFILDALDKIGRKPDFLVYLDGKGGHLLSGRLADYKARHRPEQRAQFHLKGFED